MEGAPRPPISREAIEILAAGDAIDLHVESFIWARAAGYRLGSRHGEGPLRGALARQADFPRIAGSGLKGSFWSVATNPLRPARSRTRVLLANLARLVASIEAEAGRMAVVRDWRGYEKARDAGMHACFVGIQGANALGRGPEDLDLLPPGLVARVTLVHMTDSAVGGCSNPLGGGRGRRGLTAAGHDLVRELDSRRILVDLAHASERTFRDALEVHDRSLPAIVSHTGVRAVRDSWRNVSDDQIRAIASTGGVVGIFAHSMALSRPLGRCGVDAMIDHVAHAVRIGGADHVAIGCDWDGFIVTPRDMRTVSDLPALVQGMLDRGMRPETVLAVMGGNALRVISAIRPGADAPAPEPTAGCSRAP